MGRRKVILKDYDPSWAEAFRTEAGLVGSVLGCHAHAIHHMGSTSIPGMVAKPIIDILLETDDLDAIDRAADDLERCGYEARGEQGIPGRRYFRKGSPVNHTHHLHVYERADPNIFRHLVFRDYLISHPDRAGAYAALKKRLATLHPEDPLQYTEGKADLMSHLEAMALAWRGPGHRLKRDRYIVRRKGSASLPHSPNHPRCHSRTTRPPSYSGTINSGVDRTR
jgi:GrpB-like predicted nucleotidyltransferase (UPF0157 family)